MFTSADANDDQPDHVADEEGHEDEPDFFEGLDSNEIIESPAVDDFSDSTTDANDSDDSDYME